MRATRAVLWALAITVLCLAPSRAAVAACGDGIVEGGEECDPGGGLFLNGNPNLATCTTGSLCFYEESCCKFNCQFVGSGPACFDGNDCTINETCNQVGQCTDGTFTSSGSTCNDELFCTATDLCNGAGSCIGTGNPCTGGSECADSCNEVLDNCFDTSGTACTNDGNACTNDVCNGSGTCTHPNNAASCNDGLFCNGADTCSSGSCSQHAGDPCAGGTECADSCNEVTDVCADPAGTACTTDLNGCTDDVCNGGGACSHPANSAPCSDGLFCNGADTCSSGSCSQHAGDPCTGGAECADSCNEPSDNCFDASGASCTGDSNECTNDVCNGTGTCTHPPLGGGTPCGSTGNDDCTDPDTCDGSGNCAANHAAGGTPAPVLCNDTAECTEDECNGSGGCQNPPLPLSTPCGDPSDGACINPDGCNGAGACVSNDETPGTPCGDPTSNDCTAADTCDGAGACVVNDAAAGTAAPTLCGDSIECTADQCNGSGGCSNPPLGTGTPCGSASDTDCTDPDTCDGAGACEAHDAAAGLDAPVQCNDSAECTSDQCNGTGGCQNPPRPASFACGDPLATECSGPDVCDGAGACSANDFADGTPCSDADLCTTGDACSAGACITTPVDCADTNPCTFDRCDPSDGSCLQTAEPNPNCRTAAAGAFSVVDNANDKRDLIKWKWFRGEATAFEDFADPIATTQYDVCIYDTLADVPRVASHMILPPSALWEIKSESYKFKDKTAALDGLSSARLRPGEEGKARLSLVAKGLNLPTPIQAGTDYYFDLDPALTVQLSNDEGICWSSEFDQSFRNTNVKFKTKRKVLVN